MTDTSPYHFGLNAIYLSLIPPLFYFLSKTLEGIFFPAQPFANLAASKSNLLRTVSPNTCSLTELEETSIYNDHRSAVEAGQVFLACFSATLLSLVLQRSEVKWNRSSAKGRWAYYLQRMRDFNDYNIRLYDDPWGREWNAATPHMVPSHNDYRISQRREATRLLFRVMIAACLCPVADFFLCTRESVSDRLYNQEGGVEETGFLWRGLLVIYLIFRYGISPCFLIAVASRIFISERTEEDTAVVAWERWIEKWIKAHQMENAAAEAKWMAEMNVIEPGDGSLYLYFPEQNLKTQMYAE